VRVIVTDLVMEVAMMDIEDVEETSNVDLTTASSLVLTIMRRMTAVRGQIILDQQFVQPISVVGHGHNCLSHQEVKGATEEILEVEDVVHLRSLVMKERVIVMDLVMEVVMMVTEDALGTLYVDLTTV